MPSAEPIVKPSAGPASAADSTTEYCASIAILVISISPIPINNVGQQLAVIDQPSVGF